MCYSGMCSFENHMGDCRVKNSEKFRSELDESPCLIGGMPLDKESEEYIKENSDRLAELAYEAYEKKLVW